MATLFYDKDIDDSILRDKVVAVLGYGSQGHAHALNLKDSGFNVVVGLYEGSRSKQKAEEAGLEVLSNADAVGRADLISFCLPDTTQAKVYREDVEPNLSAGKTLLFAHGFTILYEQIAPPEGVDVVMIAPKAPGHRVRAVFERGLYFPYEDRTTRPAGLEILAPREARVTLYEGLYHQIKRLFGHFDNRVVALHRERIGPIRLDPSLAPGQYRALGADEIRLPGPAEPDVQELRRP